jgi:catechol 2,3-dioxygenase-like lactoylglutathione lyase family enzyme
VLHLVQRPDGQPHHDGSGNVDHIAFEASDLEATRRALTEAGLPFREAVVPRDGTIQIFVPDPDGVMVELNFARR